MTFRNLWRQWRDYSWRDLLLVVLPSLLLLFAGFWLAARYIQPAPPDTLVFSSGGEGGAYQSFAKQYRDNLEKNSIHLVEQPSSGAVENLARLRAGEVDAAFVQGGITQSMDDEDLHSLGSLYYEPLWLFYRDQGELGQLSQLRGKRIAVGPEGSGTRQLALKLLEANGIAEAPTTLLPLSGLAAAQALEKGEVDAVILVGAPHSGTIWSLLYAKDVKLMSFSQAEGYSRRFPFLDHVVLPAGAIDFTRNLPAKDVHLLSPVATIVVRSETHPALVDLLVQAAVQIHGTPGLFHKFGDFPNATPVNFPLSPNAERFYKSGRPFLQRYLPFWAANLLDRMVVMLIPVVALLFPLMRILPGLYAWRVRSRIFRWYGELKFLEQDVDIHYADQPPEIWQTRLDDIERGANHLKAPLAFAEHIYTLRAHIAMVRATLQQKATSTNKAKPRSSAHP